MWLEHDVKVGSGARTGSAKHPAEFDRQYDLKFCQVNAMCALFQTLVLFESEHN